MATAVDMQQRVVYLLRCNSLRLAPQATTHKAAHTGCVHGAQTGAMLLALEVIAALPT